VEDLIVTRSIQTTQAVGLICCLYFSTKHATITCITNGCAIYANYTFAGLSFYGWGAVFFLSMLLFSVVRRAQRLQPAMIIVALVVDAGFLAYQAIFWPCTNCLVIAALLGSLGIVVLRQQQPGLMRQITKTAVILWGLLFCTVSVSAIKQAAITPWAAIQAESPVATVFFSPTCPSCSEMVKSLLDSPDVAGIQFVPVAKNNVDRERLAALPAEPAAKDLLVLFDQQAPRGEVDFRTRQRLWRNQSALASLGITSVPVLVSSVLPEQKPSFSLPGFNMTLPMTAPAKHSGSCSMAVEEDPACTFPQ
jgi:hypothetical protein